jgi:superfamily II DNA or RNA helicase
MYPYSLADIKRAIPTPYFERGLDYQRMRRVLEVHVDHQGRKVTGRVQGKATLPYKIVAYIKPRPRGAPLIHGMCDCPVGGNCKHVAAVLIQLLAERPPAVERPTVMERPTIAARAFRSNVSAGIGDAPLQDWLTRLEQALAPTTTAAPADAERLLYLLRPDRRFDPPRLRLELMTVRTLKAGGYGKARPFRGSATTRYLSAADRKILHWLAAGELFSMGAPTLHGADGARLLQDILATGSGHWLDKDSPPLTLGEPRRMQLQWVLGADGTQRLQGVGEGIDELLPLEPPWYLDLARHQCGPAEAGLPDALAAALLASPPIAPQQAAAARAALQRRAPQHDLPLPRTFDQAEDQRVEPVPCLRLFVQTLPVPRAHQWQAGTTHIDVELARLTFDYAGTAVGVGDPRAELMHIDGTQLARIPRDRRAEARALKTLVGFGFEPFADSFPFDVPAELMHDLEIIDDNDRQAALLEFSLQAVPALRQQGWRVEMDADYPFRVVAEAREWYAHLDEEPDHDWFGLELGVLVNGQRVSLLPILLNLMRQHPQQMDLARLKSAPPGETLYARLEDGGLLPLPVARLIPILDTLTELYDTESVPGGRLRLPAIQAAQLAALDTSPDQPLEWAGGERLREMGRKLRDFHGVRDVAPPSGLRASLRAYQQQGLNWLQFLREYQLGGLLADDMGLGKTIQTLAHLLLEKESGRMDRPSLVIAPTSLMVNWRMEAERFAPALRVLVLQGAQRMQRFDDVAGHDVVLTTYPLLPRDQEVLLARDYHLLILDEAQVIKNPKAKVSQIVRQLRARHRLCLTGTPMENHLGELWSLFHFLMPGLLGDELRFRRVFRTPIEKHGDNERRASLARRIAPFLLRRTKQEVVQELPPKTEIVRSVELGTAQRDLYESLRLAMHSKIQQEIGRKGMARSHIVILDALLKLRQVCCDPRLVKLEAARRVKGSAKLELLMQMLPELVEEGRRVLLFSQFTGMLALIEDELGRIKLPYVKLTGDTKDRATPIRRFQAGEIPLFLISLKAGGTGLNLTAADTVIHYDPWWNPAVENQATDRAHRIGQDKPVFVYKLLTMGSVEEKILAMQTRKKALADSLFGEPGKRGPALTLDDLNALFEPMA